MKRLSTLMIVATLATGCLFSSNVCAAPNYGLQPDLISPEVDAETYYANCKLKQGFSTYEGCSMRVTIAGICGRTCETNCSDYKKNGYSSEYAKCTDGCTRRKDEDVKRYTPGEQGNECTRTILGRWVVPVVTIVKPAPIRTTPATPATPASTPINNYSTETPDSSSGSWFPTIDIPGYIMGRNPMISW